MLQHQESLPAVTTCHKSKGIAVLTFLVSVHLVTLTTSLLKTSAIATETVEPNVPPASSIHLIHYFPKIHCNITLPFMSRSHKRSLFPLFCMHFQFFSLMLQVISFLNQLSQQYHIKSEIF
jgi:hypothetical protein